MRFPLVVLLAASALLVPVAAADPDDGGEDPGDFDPTSRLPACVDRGDCTVGNLCADGDCEVAALRALCSPEGLCRPASHAMCPPLDPSYCKNFTP